MRKLSVSGRGWAYIGAILGGTVSIAANVAHSYIPPTEAPVDWAPQTGAVVGAIFWPVALFVGTEIFSRVVWPSGRAWVALRFGGLLPVALVAALVSYEHLAGLLSFYGYDAVTAHLGPLAVDGLMVVASAALLATVRRTTALPVPAESPAPVATEPEPVVAPVIEAKPAPAPAVKKTPAKRVTPRPASAEKVAKAAAKMPGAPVAQIAAKAGVSPSTARRHLAALNATDASPSAPVPAETPELIAA